LIEAIRTIAAGNRVIDPDVAYTAIGAVDSPLTERETTVLRRTADGCSPREVATSMHLSYGTVRNYLASAVTKLGARNRVDAIRSPRRQAGSDGVQCAPRSSAHRSRISAAGTPDALAPLPHCWPQPE